MDLTTPDLANVVKGVGPPFAELDGGDGAATGVLTAHDIGVGRY